MRFKTLWRRIWDYTGRTSPGWPMMMIDLYFEGQRSAAVLSRNTGMTIVSMQVKNAPVAIELQDGISDRLFMEDCLFENVKKGVVVGSRWMNAYNQ